MSQPPPPSPIYDYVVDNSKKTRSVALGIALGALFLFSTPFVLLWISDRRKRCRRPHVDLEGTTEVSERAPRRERRRRRENNFLSEDTTLALSLPGRSVIDKEDARGEENSGPNPVPTKPVTEEQILGIDKASYLRSLPIGEGRLRLSRMHCKVHGFGRLVNIEYHSGSGRYLSLENSKRTNAS